MRLTTRDLNGRDMGVDTTWPDHERVRLIREERVTCRRSMRECNMCENRKLVSIALHPKDRPVLFHTKALQWNQLWYFVCRRGDLLPLLALPLASSAIYYSRSAVS